MREGVGAGSDCTFEMRKRGCDRMVWYGMVVVVRQCLSVASERCNFGSSSCSVALPGLFQQQQQLSFFAWATPPALT